MRRENAVRNKLGKVGDGFNWWRDMNEFVDKFREMRVMGIEY